MAQGGSHGSAKPYAQLASTLTSAEELGVLFMKSIMRSAMAHKITSEDGKSLVVPFAVTVAPAAAAGEGPLDTILCSTMCWKVFDQEVLCYTRCTTIHPETPAAHKPPDDRTLMGLVTPGPPLKNPAPFEQALAGSVVRAGTPMEAGIVLTNAVLSSLAKRPDLIGDDGSAQVTGIATLSMINASTAVSPDYSVCVEQCVSILGHNVICLEHCEAVIQ